MDDAARVGVVERSGKLVEQLQRAFEWQAAFGDDQVFERTAFDPLEGDVGLALVFAEFVDGGDVGMFEVGGGGFAVEAGEGLRVAAEVWGQDFEGDRAVECRVNGR